MAKFVCLNSALAEEANMEVWVDLDRVVWFHAAPVLTPDDVPCTKLKTVDGQIWFVQETVEEISKQLNRWTF